MVEEYSENIKRRNLPRLPLEGKIDLTYRCNNNCRHCWLGISPGSKEKEDELSFEEIIRIVNEARSMGCHKWIISGGEPMLRPDFPGIFEYLAANSAYYTLNTNGTLITPKIARMMKRKGAKMVALYGATAEVHDHITRNPGSFEATMQGFAYLKEAGAGFIVQIIPMKDNYHQLNDMLKLSESLSKHYRIGAAWLWLSASGDPERNKEIMRQRLPPEEVIKLDTPDLSGEDRMKEEHSGCLSVNDNGYLFSSCINLRRDFHIDPYGKMTFCSFIKDAALRYDLRKGSFEECWEEFIPSLSNKVKATKEYRDNCGSCEYRQDCRWCPVHSYLEHRNFNVKTEYLCAAAENKVKFKNNWQKNHRRYFKIADITIQVESDLPFSENTFHPKFRHFEVTGPGDDMISIRHHFFLPDIKEKDLGKEIYRKVPWAISKNEGSWIYKQISPVEEDKSMHRMLVFDHNHNHASIYNDKEVDFIKGDFHSLTFLPTDQILLARILADRQGCYLHSCGVNFNNKGLLFVGHSEAGKSTMATLLKGRAEILCDDRIIVRKNGSGFKIHGTWSHGDVPEISANSAPLKAILFLEKSKNNQLVLLNDKKEIIKRLLSYLIKSFVTADWWEKTISLIEDLSAVVPCYELHFDKSPAVVELLEDYNY